ncbi:ArsR family transcriptional regulator [soil metagenome]
MRTSPPVLAPVFRSDGQARVLSAVLLDGGELSVRDIATRSGIAYATVHGEIERLLSAEVFTERRVGRSRLISANPTSPLVPPLREILLISTGPAALLSVELAKIDGVQRAFLYGSFAARSRGVDGPAPNDIDLMVIGNPDLNDVYDACSRVEQSVGRPVNVTILTPAEFDSSSGFLDSVRSSPTVAIIGSNK